MTNIFKNWNITLPAKVFLVQAIIFPVVIYRCESWTIQKAEPWNHDDFKVWCWTRLLHVLWTAREWNRSVRNSVLKIFGRTDARAEATILWLPDTMNWLMPMTPVLGKIEGRRRSRWQRMRLSPSPTEWRWVWASYGSWWWTEEPGVPQALGLQIVGHNWATELNLCWG